MSSTPAAIKPSETKVSTLIELMCKGLSGMGATLCVQPLDLVKTRMQVAGAGGGKSEYKNSIDCLTSVVRKEGLTKLYAGIGAALLRQATYTTTRLGVAAHLNNAYKDQYKSDPTFLIRLCTGATSGACGALVGNPAEVALIRMTADGRLPIAERRNYTSVVNALKRITTEEGFFSLFRGCIPTMGRAMVVNMVQLASYGQTKEYFIKEFQMQNGVLLYFSAAMISGFLTTVASMPFDIAKTRIQNMKSIDGKPEYKGSFDVLFKVCRKEGFFALYKGFNPYLWRLGPHTVLTFMIMEQLSQFYSEHILGIEYKGSGL